MENEYHLTPKQVFTRVVSAFVCAIGIGACVFSLTMQVREIGTLMSSVTWFSGLFAVVFGIAGYAVTCDVGERKNYVRPAVVAIAVLGIAAVVVAQTFLTMNQVIIAALIAAGVQVVLLVVYHFALKRQDPDSL